MSGRALTLEMVADAVLWVVRDFCLARNCGCPGKGMSGTRNRHVRCGECPLDCVDTLADALFAAEHEEC
jgi:hypothetical protein